MKLLRCSRDIPHGIGLPALLPVLEGGQISSAVEEASVTLAYQTRLLLQCGNIREKNTDGSFADLCDAPCKQAVHQGSECVVVEALSETLVEGDVEESVETLKFLP